VIEVRTSDYMMMDSLAIWVLLKFEGQGRRVLRLGDDNLTRNWEEVPDPALEVKPTLVLDNESARVLLDALLRHYQGASDMHTVRSDLLHERKRVDKLTDALIGIAAAPSPR
jgi:hypothetical protein